MASTPNETKPVEGAPTITPKAAPAPAPLPSQPSNSGQKRILKDFEASQNAFQLNESMKQRSNVTYERMKAKDEATQINAALGDKLVETLVMEHLRKR